MKKISLLIIASFMVVFGFSQSFQVITADTIMHCIVGQTCGPANATIRNISGSSKSALCKRAMIYENSGDMNYFCWGATCYPPNANVAVTSQVINGSTSDSTFKGYVVNSSSIAINDTIKYTVFDQSNVNDSVSWTVVWMFSTGINELATKNSLLSSYPEPSNESTLIQYSLTKDVRAAKLKVMDMIGSTVAEYSIDTRQNKFLLPTGSLKSGIYFYSLEVDGKSAATKKLLVSH
ncbi:MAG: T9SS type A sorting domain-containing protein [Bacteroidota bacterium]